MPKSGLLRLEDRTGNREFVGPVDQFGIERKRYKRIGNVISDEPILQSADAQERV